MNDITQQQVQALQVAVEHIQAVLDTLVEPPPAPVPRPRQPGQPLLLSTLNYAGYPLEQCLRGMLKKWDEAAPGWPVTGGLPRQAKTFKCLVEDLYATIATNKQLTSAFLRWPECGFGSWYAAHRDD